MADTYGQTSRAPVYGLSQSPQAPIDVERKASATEQALGFLSDQHARLDSLVGELERRLSVVLLPIGPENPKNTQAQLPSQLSNKIHCEAELVKSVCERLDSIIARVDL